MKKLSILLAALCLCILFIGCASRTPFTINALKTAAEATDMAYTEEDPATLGVTGVASAGTVNADTASARVVLFDTPANARALYANIVSTLETIEGTRNNVDSSTYNKLTIKGVGGYFAVIRTENTLFFGSDQNSGQIENLLKSMGY